MADEPIARTRQRQSVGRPARLTVALLLLPLLPQASGPSTSTVPAPAGIAGRFLMSEGRRPIAGALVALYERRSGYLLDSTYTANDGRFALRPQPTGEYTLVVTKGDISKRAELAYDAGAAGVYREIVHGTTKPSLLSRVRKSAASFATGAFGTITAFFLGFYLKQWEGRSQAKRTLNRETTRLRILVRAARDQLQDVTGRSAPLTTGDYDRAIADLQPRVADIDSEARKDSIRDAAYQLRGATGSEQHIEYVSQVERIKGLISSPATGFGGQAERLSELRTLLEKLDTHALIRPRQPWWRRAASTS